MNTRFLKSFVAVSECGSLAAAGRRLGITPAAVAQRIRALETEMGCKLLSRSGRRVRPTEAGVAIFPRIQSLLHEIRDIKTLAKAPSVAGELRIGSISTAITGLVPNTLQELVAHHPDLQIHLDPDTSTELYNKVIEGYLDAAIIIQPHFLLPKSCYFSPVRREPLILIAPSYVSGRSPYAILKEMPFIRYDRHHWGGRLADTYMKDTGLKLVERFELDSLEAIAIMVDRGLGVSLVPDWAPPWPEGLSLIKIPVSTRYDRLIGLLSMTQSPRARLICLIIDALRVAEMDPDLGQADK